jgi:phosphoribosylanthranilate isomerase
MISLKVKICGLTNLEDALAAVEMGADMLGFIFYPKSPRFIDFEKAREIIRKIPTFVDTVGLFVNPSAEQVRRAYAEGWLNWIQLHGDESPEFCRSLLWMNCKLIKAIRVRSKKDVQRAAEYPADIILLDHYSKDRYGGTGERFDWSWLEPMNQRIMLSGGITPDNVVEAIETGVYGIDVCSGIESQPGRKDHEKMRQLFENIRRTAGGKVKA